MASKITLYSFADVDRSGKVRWLACELGYEIDEQRLELGAHRSPAYLELNPYGQVPTAVIDGSVVIESTAICQLLAERHPEAGLIPADTTDYWQYVNLMCSTLETPVVNYILAQRGIVDESWMALVRDSLQFKLGALLRDLPGSGFLCGAFSLADIHAAYVLRIAVQSGLLPYEGVLAAYLGRLRERPAAIESRFFEGLVS